MLWQCLGLGSSFGLVRKSWEMLQDPEMSPGETGGPRAVTAFTLHHHSGWVQIWGWSPQGHMRGQGVTITACLSLSAMPGWLCQGCVALPFPSQSGVPFGSGGCL